MKPDDPRRTVDNSLRHIKIKADEEPRTVPVDKTLENTGRPRPRREVVAIPPRARPPLRGSPGGSFQRTGRPDPDTTAGPNSEPVVINDSATFAGASGGNVLWSAPLETLFFDCLYKGPIAGSGATSNGLVVSAIPPGVAIIVDFGS